MLVLNKLLFNSKYVTISKLIHIHLICGPQQFNVPRLRSIFTINCDIPQGFISINIFRRMQC